MREFTHLNMLPETHFFRILNKFQKDNLLNLVTPKVKRKHKQQFAKIDMDVISSDLQNCIFLNSYRKRFLGALDRLSSGYDGWVEKTPSHIRDIETITRLDPSCHFIHVIRNAASTIASIREMHEKYPEVWTSSGSPDPIEKITQRWIDDAKLSDAYAPLDNHTIVYYEQFVSCPEGEIKKALSESGTPTLASGSRTHTNSEAIQPWEKWKQKSSQAVDPNISSKFYQLPKESQEAVSKMLSQVKFDNLSNSILSPPPNKPNSIH